MPPAGFEHYLRYHEIINKTKCQTHEGMYLCRKKKKKKKKILKSAFFCSLFNRFNF